MIGVELEEEGGLGYSVGGDSFDVDDDAEDGDASTLIACTVNINDDDGKSHTNVSPTSFSSSGAKKRAYGTKNKSFEYFVEAMDRMNEGIKQLIAVMTMQSKEEFLSKLWTEVMDLEGFDIHVLDAVFRYLGGNESEANLFLARQKPSRAHMVYNILSKLPRFWMC
uniref:Uncharacterized protein n=1 Tax=Nelumbo nucifera TaxID=4432 RepID=A0A822YX90_NELNU|nr:TPA_asm: hypothetical protein HUJ06_007771 [Nelumbo nucifera]